MESDAGCFGTDFTIAAFNAHWGVGRFGRSRGIRFDVAHVVDSFDADIVVVVESWRDDDGCGMLDPLTQLGYHIESTKLLPLVERTVRGGVEDSAPRQGLWELAVCSRFPVLHRREIILDQVGADPVSARRALWCRVEIAGRPIEVVGLHTSSKLWRLGPVRHIRSLKAQLDAAGPQIVAGDFNLWGPPVSMLMRGWERPVRGRTYPSHRPHSQIDHVLVRGDIDAIDGEVLAATPSDHRPVRARLRLPGPAS